MRSTPGRACIPERAREQARAADERLAARAPARRCCAAIPLGVKDLYGVAGPAADRVEPGARGQRGRPTTRSPGRGCAPRDGARRPHPHARVRGRRHDRPGRQPVGAATARRAGRAAAAPPRSPRGWSRPRWARTPAARCGSRRRAAARARSSRPTAGCRSTGSSRSRPTLDHPGPDGAHGRRLRRDARRDGRRRRRESTRSMPPPAEMGELPLAPRPGRGRWRACGRAHRPARRRRRRSGRPRRARPRPPRVRGARRRGRRAGRRARTCDRDDLNCIFSPRWAYHARHAEARDRYRTASSSWSTSARTSPRPPRTSAPSGSVRR